MQIKEQFHYASRDLTIFRCNKIHSSSLQMIRLHDNNMMTHNKSGNYYSNSESRCDLIVKLDILKSTTSYALLENFEIVNVKQSGYIYKTAKDFERCNASIAAAYNCIQIHKPVKDNIFPVISSYKLLWEITNKLFNLKQSLEKDS